MMIEEQTDATKAEAEHKRFMMEQDRKIEQAKMQRRVMQEQGALQSMGRMINGTAAQQQLNMPQQPNAPMSTITGSPTMIAHGITYDMSMGLVVALDFVSGIPGEHVGAPMRFVHLLYLKSKPITKMKTSKKKMTAKQDLEPYAGQDETTSLCFANGSVVSMHSNRV